MHTQETSPETGQELAQPIAPLTFEEMEAEWGDPQTIHEFEVIDPKGVKRKFKASIAQDMVESMDRAEKMKGLMEMLTKAPVGDAKQYAPVSEPIARSVAVLHLSMVEPKLGIVDALKWCRTRAVFVGEIMNKMLQMEAKTVVATEEAKVEEIKND